MADGTPGIVSLDMLTPSQGWTVGGLTLGRIEDGTWREITWPGEPDMEGESIDAIGPQDVWLGGSFRATGGGMLMHLRDGTWTTVVQDAPGAVWDIEMLSADEGWAVTGGAAAAILEYHDGKWATLEGSFRGYLHALDMITPDEGWAAGFGIDGDERSGVLMHYRSCALQLATATPTPDTPTPRTPTPTPTATPTATTAAQPPGVFLPYAERGY